MAKLATNRSSVETKGTIETLSQAGSNENSDKNLGKYFVVKILNRTVKLQLDAVSDFPIISFQLWRTLKKRLR